MKAKKTGLRIKVYQQDWMPGFAAFSDDGSVAKGKAHIALNIGALMAAVQCKDIEAKDVPYAIAEDVMHEVMHSLEAWAGVEFSEARVEALLEKYRKTYKGAKW